MLLNGEPVTEMDMAQVDVGQEEPRRQRDSAVAEQAAGRTADERPHGTPGEARRRPDLLPQLEDAHAELSGCATVGPVCRTGPGLRLASGSGGTPQGAVQVPLGKRDLPGCRSRSASGTYGPTQPGERGRR